MAPIAHLTALLHRSLPDSSNDASTTTSLLQRRSTSTVSLGTGAKPASAYNNRAFLALFALIGAGMVIGSIWFFFWARNGGFRWRGKDDWDDYKSTVLRRKGPDGRTLSNATKSTRLGGGSVVHGGSYDGGAYSMGYTDESSMVDEKEDRRAGEGIRGGGARPKRHDRKRDRNHDPDVRQYRQEKAARVGGLNRTADGNHFDYSATEPSELSQAPLLKEKNGTPDKKAAKREAEARKKEHERREKERKREEKEAAKAAAAQEKKEKEEAKKAKKAAKSAKGAMGWKRSASKSRTRSPSPAKRSRGPEMSEQPRAQQQPRRSQPSAAYSFTTGDDYTETATSYSGVYTADFTEDSAQRSASYYSSYRPHAGIARPAPAARAYDPPATKTSSSPRHDRERRSAHNTPRASRDSVARDSHRSRSRQHSESPRKHHRASGSRSRDVSRSRGHRYGGHSRAGSATELLSEANSDTGTKSYPCVIPGLSKGPDSVSPFESVSQVGANHGQGRRGRNVMDGYGYRRGRGRRDSLSESDGE